MLRMLLECHESCTLDRTTTALAARHRRKLWDVLNLNWSFHDLSKWQAWEQLGLIYEKEQAYKDAKTGSCLSWHGHLPHLTKMSWLWISWSRMLLLIMRKPGSSAMRLLLLWAGALVLDSYDHRRCCGCKAEAIAWPSTTWKQNAS